MPTSSTTIQLSHPELRDNWYYSSYAVYEVQCPKYQRGGEPLLFLFLLFWNPSGMLTPPSNSAAPVPGSRATSLGRSNLAPLLGTLEPFPDSPGAKLQTNDPTLLDRVTRFATEPIGTHRPQPILCALLQDFVWLRDVLRKQFPVVFLPVLPPKGNIVSLAAAAASVVGTPPVCCAPPA